MSDRENEPAPMAMVRAIISAAGREAQSICAAVVEDEHSHLPLGVKPVRDALACDIAIYGGLVAKAGDAVKGLSDRVAEAIVTQEPSSGIPKKSAGADSRKR